MSSLNLYSSSTVDADPYERTLIDLRARTNALTEALDAAEARRGPIGRAASLTELHTQLRGMAAVANHALGGWPTDDQVTQ